MNAYKVLIIDDEPHISRVLKLKLENADYEVITAINGIDGLEKFVKEKPQIIITDINMPLIDGKELCKIIDDYKDKNPFFIIVMTSSVERDVYSWAKENKNFHFVEKPFSPRKILQLVNQVKSKLKEAYADV